MSTRDDVPHVRTFATHPCGLAAFASCLLALLVLPSLAAACTRAESRDLRAAMTDVGALRAAGAVAATDANAIVQRARRSCSDARFARAMASASRRLGAPVAGRRARVLGVDLVGASSSGVAVWRADLGRTAIRLATSRTDAAASALRAQLRAAASGGVIVTWSADPTRRAWSPLLQGSVVSALARSRRGADRSLALAGVRAFASTSRRAALGSLPILDHLRLANQVANGAERLDLAGARSVARSVAVPVFVRVRAAHRESWSRIGATWSTGPQHRVLVRQANVLIGRVPHPRTTATITALRASLTTPARVRFEVLPVDAFYPWPRDGAFDSQSVRFRVDKPVRLAMRIYAPDERLVRTLEGALEPGSSTMSWDGGIDGGGELAAAGDYRYVLELVDPLGNDIRVPGLDEFKVVRDTVAPVVRTVAARHVASGGTRRIVASWDVAEQHSPQVRSWLLLVKGERRVSLELHASLQRATVRRTVALAPGTWTATFVFADGSGNRVSQGAGTVVVR